MAVTADLFLLTLAYWSALALRFETLSPTLHNQGMQLLAAPLLAIPIFIKLGLYRAVIRFMEERVVFVVVGGVTLSVIGLAALAALTHAPGFSRGVLLIYWLLAIVYVGATRFLARSLILNSERRHDQRKRVAIYGAGRAGTQLAYALRAGREYWPIVFFDDSPRLQNTEVAGLRVYPPHLLERVLDAETIHEILLAIPSLSRTQRLEIFDRLEPLQCKVKLVPNMAEILSGKMSDRDLREIEIEDLLGRDTVTPDARLLGQCIEQKVVLVTGAGGSIGSELCRQIIRQRPARLILLELSEFALYSIEQELTALCDKLKIAVDCIPLLGSITHLHRNEKILRNFKVDTVYHAAAYKHVPLVEHNPVEGIQNNSIGTLRMAQASINAGVKTFVLVSTDKAVRPTNIMGASKRLAELILQALAHECASTRFCMVRFGNVLGSSGSVVPLFRKQIAQGGPITLTHEKITRYFMTIPEAAQLVIQAGSMGQGGEVYVLDMGRPVKIIDLARRMVHLSGQEIRDEDHPEGDIELEIVGLRPGEKLYEELLIGQHVEGTDHPLIMRAYEKEIPWPILEPALIRLQETFRTSDYPQALDILESLVDDYTPTRHDDEKLAWENYSGTT